MDGAVCNLARQNLEHPYVLIIDEINRGNLSKVLGERMMLLEADKRSPEWAVSLAFGIEDERFWVPPNLYIIGTMNTADRSLAMVDDALRRRFAFFDVRPGFASPNFATTLQRLEIRAQSFRRVRLHRNNRHHAFVLAVCELHPRHLLPTQEAGEWRVQDFRGSDRERGTLFEAFVRNFVRRERPEVRLLPRSYEWRAAETGAVA